MKKDLIAYCPIGSVVEVKDSKLKIMIIGTIILDLTKKGVVYDYMGCKYPEGVFDKEHILYFNHEDINKVIFQGTEDEKVKEAFLKYKKLY